MGSQAARQVSAHLLSLPHKFRHRHPPQQHEKWNGEKKANSGHTLKGFGVAIQQKKLIKKKERVRELFLKHSRDRHSQRCVCLSLTTGSPLCSFSLKRENEVPAKQHLECKSASSLASQGKKTSLLEHYCIYISNLCMWTVCQPLMCCTFR